MNSVESKTKNEGIFERIKAHFRKISPPKKKKECYTIIESDSLKLLTFF